MDQLATPGAASKSCWSPLGGADYKYAIRLVEKLSNNQAEYEAMSKGLELLLEAGAKAVEVFGDSMVAIKQLTEEYNCDIEYLYPYLVRCQQWWS